MAFHWYGEEFKAKLHKENVRRMNIATRLVANKVKKNISVKVGKEGKKVTERSKPGEFPRLDKGRLRQSIATEVVEDGDKVTGRVGTPVKYAKYLERDLDRSFLLRTKNEMLQELRAIFTKPMNI